MWHQYSEISGMVTPKYQRGTCLPAYRRIRNGCEYTNGFPTGWLLNTPLIKLEQL